MSGQETDESYPGENHPGYYHHALFSDVRLTVFL